MPSAASIQKTNLFLEKSVEVRHALIWRIILVICTGGFLGVKHFVLTATLRCRSFRNSPILLVRIWDLRLSYLRLQSREG